MKTAVTLGQAGHLLRFTVFALIVFISSCIGQDEEKPDNNQCKIIITRYEEIMLPKGIFSVYSLTNEDRDFNELFIIPKDPMEIPQHLRIAKKAWDKIFLDVSLLSPNAKWWFENYSGYDERYSKYDRLIGNVPDGKIVAKYGDNWPASFDLRYLDLKLLESGKKIRIEVRPSLFRMIEVGDQLMSDNVIPVLPMSYEEAVRREGWIISVYSAGLIEIFVPLNGKEKPFPIKSWIWHRYQNGFYGSVPDPTTKADCTLQPPGVVVAKYNCEGMWETWYFISVEHNKKVRRYFVSQSFYESLNIGGKIG